MTDKEKENRVNSLALNFLQRQQLQPNPFASQILQAYKEAYYQAEKDNSFPEEPVSGDLEEAACKYSDKMAYLDISVFTPKQIEEKRVKCLYNWNDLRTTFKAGAQWLKEQMMAKAIDAHCFSFQGAALFSFRLPADNYLVGSEVKVIVIKED